jgi:excisionase family DNA binding protein
MPRSDPAWLSISGAAHALGVSTSTIRAWAADGRIPHARTAGGHRRFNPDALAAWLTERPDPGMPREERTTHVMRSPEAADALMQRAGRIAELAGNELAPVATNGSGAAAHERHQAVLDWVSVIARALRTGRLGDALARAEAHGRAHGAAGSPAEVALAGAVAIERAVDDALGEEPVALPQAQRDHVAATTRRVTVRIADAWARATREGHAEVPAHI